MEHSVNETLEKLNRQSKELNNIYYNIATHFRLSENAFWVLYVLADTTRQYSQQDISEEWSFSKQTVNSTISVLVKKGFVYLERTSGSKRKKIVRLTEVGKAFVHNNFILIRQAEEKALLHMNEREREIYITLFGKYIAYLREEIELCMQ